MAAGDDRHSGRRRARTASADERELWHQVMRDTTPMRTTRRAPVDVPDATDPGTERTSGRSDTAGASNAQTTGQPARKAPPRPQPTPPIQPKKPPDPGVTPGRTVGVDRRTADRLKRGRLEIDGRIDLHGMTRAAAQDALTAFVVSAAERGQRCVLVITGKGTFSGGPGVLKQEVPKWLNMAPLRERIVAVTEAQPKHGGAGALYVLLKRKRG
jgi:DNA-nicking Smr family endonuclease